MPIASVKTWSTAADPSLMQIRVSGITGIASTQVLTANVRSGNLLDYVLLVNENYTLDVGQKLTVLGGQGRIHIEGDFQLASGFLKERLTGAAQLTNLLPNLPDIDAFVTSFQSQAAVAVASSGDVPCGAGSLKSFANGPTLQVVTVVEVDVAQLNSYG